MKLPENTSSDEIRIVLKDIFELYLPDVSIDFIDELEEEDIYILLDFIITKDHIQREKNRSIIQDRIHNYPSSVSKILQQAEQIQIKFKEKKSDFEDSTRLEEIEKMF